MVWLITIKLAVLAAYGAVGLVVAIYSHFGLLAKMDPGVQGTSLGFRLLITPGIVALWPLLLWQLKRHGHTPIASPYERPLRATTLLVWQRLGTQALAVLLPILLVIILAARKPPTLTAPPDLHLPAMVVPTSLEPSAP